MDALIAAQKLANDSASRRIGNSAPMSANPGTPTETITSGATSFPQSFGVDGDVPQYAISFTAESFGKVAENAVLQGRKNLITDLDA